jgi:hypothetical protein
VSSTTDRAAGAPFRPADVARFRYVGYDLDPSTGVLTCRYALDDLDFTERITFALPDGATAGTAGTVDPDALDAALRLVFLLAGISYYKAAAPPLIDVPEPGLTPAERRLLEAFYRDGLGEYAYRNELDLSGIEIVAAERPPVVPLSAAGTSRPLVPFGGGIDSIVTVEGVRARTDDAALFVVSREGDRFDAIESPAATTGLPVVRAERRLDDKILQSAALGYRNGHVPVTGVLSAIAVVAALLDGRDAVIMSNEWSASSGNTEQDGRVVNHQWSKSLAFEDLFRAALIESVAQPVDYCSWLRPRSELWVASRFAALDRYHPSFRSCNRAFHIDPSRRLDHWCGHCDKCCFIDLILAPYVDAAALAAVFDGHEPLDDPELAGTFRTLVGATGDIKPFECVGDVDECRVATLVAAGRSDRPGTALLQSLADEVRAVVPGALDEHVDGLLAPLGPHRIPDRYAPPDLLG